VIYIKRLFETLSELILIKPRRKTTKSSQKKIIPNKILNTKSKAPGKSNKNIPQINYYYLKTNPNHSTPKALSGL